MSGGDPIAYVELDARSNFSFLEGAAHPHELVWEALRLGLGGIGLADRNTLSGVVRGHSEAKRQARAGAPIRFLVGCRLQFTDGCELIVYPRDRPAYGRLCRLLSQGKAGDELRVRPPPGSETHVPEVTCDNIAELPLKAPAGAGPRSSPSGGRGPEGADGGELDAAPVTCPPTPLRGEPPRRGSIFYLPPPTVGENDPPPDPPPQDRIAKGDCRLTFEQAVALGEGLIALVPAPARIDAAFEARLQAWRKAWPERLYVLANPLHRGGDRARLNRLAEISRRAGAPMVASNSPLYDLPDRRRLQDVVTCIREGCTIEAAGRRLQANAGRHIRSPQEMARLFRGHEEAIARTVQIAEACSFSLDQLAYDYPDEPVPRGWTAQRQLIRLTFKGARAHWPEGVSKKIVATIAKELRLIRKVKYANYFLTVHDIVAWARDPQRDILCQGRGSAANSVVCFCLGITAVDPTEQDVLFERFISEKRQEPPDIDVDFEHERREEVIQYVYRRYGRHRAAICATVIHYRPRSAIREVGKVLGLTEDVTAALANTVWGSYGDGVEDRHVDQTGLKRDDPRLALALSLAAQLIGFPRHLSQHVGGFILTQGPLIETVPVGNGAMADRTFIEWDKDDIDDLKILKVDVLALGMLTAIRKAFDMIDGHFGRRWTLATVPPGDAEVYEMLCRADSLGVFQVESRAQMAMLPRLQPRQFYDLVVEVAIVRPGPIQGDMVHPYLKRRTEQREAKARGEAYEIDFPAPHPDQGHKDELRNVLGKTLGVPLFQEQAMRIAMEAALFTGEEANGLRRAMATFRHMGTIHEYEAMLSERMIARGYPETFARNCVKQIQGFGEYGFPESHAAAFARLVYISAWIKWFHPEVFAAALLNSQPMGFYAPAQIVRDARDHGVDARPPDANLSDWDCTLEEGRERTSEKPFSLEGRRVWDEGDGPSADVASEDNELGRNQFSASLRDEGRDGENVFGPRVASATAVPPERPSPSSPALLPSREKGDHDASREMGDASRNQPLPLRLGLRQIDGFRKAWAEALMAAREAGGPFTCIDDLRHRAGLPAAALDLLASADALGSLHLQRRPGLWAAKGMPRAAPAPLFAAAGLEEGDGRPPAHLPRQRLSEEVVDDYQTLRLSLKAHPMSFLRGRMRALKAIPCEEVERVRDGARIAVGGVVLVRQRPGSAKGVVFLTLEDETGIANVVVWPKIFEKYRPLVMGARMMLVRGRIQRAEGVTHMVAEIIEDRSHELSFLSDDLLTPQRDHGDGATSAAPDRGEPRGWNDDPRSAHADGHGHARRHPRNVRVLPPSRDFH